MISERRNFITIIFNLFNELLLIEFQQNTKSIFFQTYADNLVIIKLGTCDVRLSNRERLLLLTVKGVVPL